MRNVQVVDLEMVSRWSRMLLVIVYTRNSIYTCNSIHTRNSIYTRNCIYKKERAHACARVIYKKNKINGVLFSFLLFDMNKPSMSNFYTYYAMQYIY